MVCMEENKLKELLESQYQNGIERGKELMQQKMLSACENGTPILLPDNRVYFVKSDLQNLQDVFADIEANVK